MKDENNENLTQSKSVKGSYCPMCGRMVQNRWYRVCINLFFAFLAFAVCAFVCFAINCSGIGSGILGISSLMLIVLAGITLFVLPITGSLAIVSRSHCKVCNHRFWPNSIETDLPPNVNYPQKYTIIGNAILLVIFFVEAVLFYKVPGNEMISVEIEIAGWIFIAWLLLVPCMLGQALIWRNLVYHKTNLLYLLPIIAFVVGFMVFSLHQRGELVVQNDPVPRATKILNAANLANLPESAKNVHVYAYQVLFIARVYVSFEAEPNDIEKFIADSPALEKLTCHTYSKNRMRLATDDYGLIVDRQMRTDPNVADILEIIQEDAEFSDYFASKNDDGHEYFDSIKEPPSWYKEEIRGAGRYYDLSVPEADRYGELIIDDEKHIVYMYRGN